ncbi:MAG: translocation/assembly module TamB domain-containing protein, partial [Candidatus Saganbacteria bacterium]|nr:translocation/assembly module TamB domain-containing protein [Candidatus Saganbacteria bacterium]
HRDVKIKSAGGRIAGQIVLKGVAISPDLKAEIVKLNFSIAKYILNKGDITPALSSIEIEGANVRVTRDKNNNINLVSLFVDPNAKSDSSAAPPPKINIKIKDSKVNYIDQAGIYEKINSTPYHFNFLVKSGVINLKNPQEMKFSLNAFQDNSIIKINGNYNPAKEKYNIVLSAKNLNAKKWGPFAVPLDLIYKSGHTNLELNLKNDYLKIFTSGIINGSSVKVNGELKDFTRPTIDFKIEAKNALLEEIKPVFPELSSLDIKGLGNAKFKINGSVNSLKYLIDLDIKKGFFYQHPFTGKTSLLYKNDILTISSSKLNIFKGKMAAEGTVDFNTSVPKLNIKISSSNTSLYDLSYKTPGIKGSGAYTLTLSGNINRFIGSLKGSFSNASVLGQPISNAEIDFAHENGETLLEKINIYSKDAYFKSFGSISKNLETALSVEASGIQLSGENFTGKIQSHVKNFSGGILFKLGPEFFSSPVRNITARGAIEIGRTQIAEQIIDSGSGKIAIARGMINIPHFIVKKGGSTVNLYGQTGINIATKLKIVSKQLNLEDAKILNLVLPQQLKNPQGICDLDISVGGTIKREEKMTSLDPFLDLDYKGKFSLLKGNFNGIIINSAKTDFQLKKRELSIKSAEVNGKNSKITLSLFLDKDKIDLSSKGKIDFSDFSTHLAQFGRIDGSGNYELNYSGKLSDPKVVLLLDFKNFVYNNVYLGKMKSKVSYAKGELTLTEPLIIESKNSKYELAGKIFTGKNINNPKWDLDFKIHKASLEKLLPLSLKIAKLVSAKTKKGSTISEAAYNIKKLKLPAISAYTKDGELLLYAKEGPSYLKAWAALEKTLKKIDTDNIPKFWHGIRGQVRAHAKVQGTTADPIVSFAAKMNDCFYNNYQADSLEIQGKYENDLINFNKFLLGKKRGSFLVWGIFDPKGSNNNLAFKAKEMPVDLLELVCGKKEYIGNFNLNGTISGSFSKPEASLSLVGKNLSLAKIKYKQISAEASLANNFLKLKHFTIATDNDISKCFGTYSLDDSSLDLSISLNGLGIGIINLFNQEVYFVDGKTKGQLQIYPSLKQPRVKGFLTVNNSSFRLNKYDSEIVSASLQMEADGNTISIPQIYGYWVGKTTKNKPNLIALAASINLETGSLEARAKNTHLNLALENTFSGEIETKDIALKGTTNKMLLSGQMEFNDGVIYLPKQTKKSSAQKAAALPLNFDMVLNFNKNMYLTAGDVNTIDLSNLFLSLEFSGREIKLKGNTIRPELIGQVDFKRGNITVFNREFDLLSIAKQKNYYPYEYDKTSPNYAILSPEYGSMPYLNLTADVVVETTDDSDSINNTGTENISSTTKKKTVNIVTHLKGVPGSSDSTQGLKTNFEAFDEDKTTQPPQMVKAAYSEQQVKVLLLPDYVKSLIGAGKGDVEGTDIFADYLGSRLQVLVFRNLERNLEKALGLESLTLQYNFGKDIRRNLGRSGYAGPKPLYGVGFVKGFFDRLYFGVKYLQYDQEEVLQSGGTNFNYEISYKLSPSLSFAYYREPLTYTGVDTDYYKITLKNGVQF